MRRDAVTLVWFNRLYTQVEKGYFKNMARYSKSAQKDVERAVRKMKTGTLKSGRSRKTVKSRKQAIAIGLSEARSKGKKVPPAPKT